MSAIPDPPPTDEAHEFKFATLTIGHDSAKEGHFLEIVTKCASTWQSSYACYRISTYARLQVMGELARRMLHPHDPACRHEITCSGFRDPGTHPNATLTERDLLARLRQSHRNWGLLLEAVDSGGNEACLEAMADRLVCMASARQ